MVPGYQCKKGKKGTKLLKWCTQKSKGDLPAPAEGRLRKKDIPPMTPGRGEKTQKERGGYGGGVITVPRKQKKRLGTGRIWHCLPMGTLFFKTKKDSAKAKDKVYCHFLNRH